MKSFLTNLIKFQPLALSKGLVKCKSKYKCAAVACIVRVDTEKSFDSAQQMLESLQDFNIEILFMKRAIRLNDPWSGHVCILVSCSLPPMFLL